MLQLIRSATLVFAVCSLAFLAGGCKGKPKQPVHVSRMRRVRSCTFVHVADPRAVSQLGSGFFDVEQGSWRCTGKKFSVCSECQKCSAKEDLPVFKLAVPEPEIQQLSPLP
jgi:hypothetical protein